VFDESPCINIIVINIFTKHIVIQNVCVILHCFNAYENDAKMNKTIVITGVEFHLDSIGWTTVYDL